MKDSRKAITEHESPFHLQKYVGFLLLLANYHKKRFSKVLRDLQLVLYPDVRLKAQKYLTAMGMPGFFSHKAKPELDPDDLLGETENRMEEGSVVFSLWFDNNDRDRYHYMPQTKTHSSHHVTICSAFTVPVEEYRWAHPLKWQGANPPYDKSILTGKRGIHHLTYEWDKQAIGLAGKVPSLWAGDRIPFTAFAGLGIKPGEDWKTTIPVIPSSSADKHLPISPTRLWTPLHLNTAATNSPGGWRAGLEWV